MKESAGPSDPSRFLPALSSPRHLHSAMGAAQGQPARFRHKGRCNRALSTHLAVQRMEASSAICRRMRCTPATMRPSASYEPARQHHAIPRPRRGQRHPGTAAEAQGRRHRGVRRKDQEGRRRSLRSLQVDPGRAPCSAGGAEPALTEPARAQQAWPLAMPLSAQSPTVLRGADELVRRGAPRTPNGSQQHHEP